MILLLKFIQKQLLSNSFYILLHSIPINLLLFYHPLLNLLVSLVLKYHNILHFLNHHLWKIKTLDSRKWKRHRTLWPVLHSKCVSLVLFRWATYPNFRVRLPWWAEGRLGRILLVRPLVGPRPCWESMCSSTWPLSLPRWGSLWVSVKRKATTPILMKEPS